ncbi:hypothetical protein Tco_1083820 [Tanacetum coccineum]
MAESSSQIPSSPKITPKEEPVTLDKPESPNPFLPADHVEFTFDEITFTANNEVEIADGSHHSMSRGKTGRLDQISNKDATIIYCLANGVQTEASKSKTGQSDKRTQSSSSKDKSPSHHLAPTHVVSKMHKEAQQAAGGLTSLSATSEEGAHPQLNSGMFSFIHIEPIHSASFTFHSEFALGGDASANSTAKADPGISDPNDSIPSQ